MSRLRFTQNGPKAGDCTASYKVDIDKECRDLTVFIRTVLEENPNEWGRIYLMETGQSRFEVPFIEYRNGELISTPEDTSFKTRPIECVTASGGWSRMWSRVDYYVRLGAKDIGTNKDERRDEWEGSENMGTKGEIVNALIENVSLSMEDHGVLCYYLVLKMNGCGCSYGGRVIGKGYLGAKEFQGYEKGTEALMRIMDVVGVHRWEDIKGKYVRVELPGWGGIVDRIGNIIEDKWFSQKEFFGGD